MWTGLLLILSLDSKLCQHVWKTHETRGVSHWTSHSCHVMQYWAHRAHSSENLFGVNQDEFPVSGESNRHVQRPQWNKAEHSKYCNKILWPPMKKKNSSYGDWRNDTCSGNGRGYIKRVFKTRIYLLVAPRAKSRKDELKFFIFFFKCQKF